VQAVALLICAPEVSGLILCRDIDNLTRFIVGFLSDFRKIPE
jgi:hypothetical protein